MARTPLRALLALACVLNCGVVLDAQAAGKVSLYASRMDPADESQRFGKTAWGGGIDAVFPWPAAHDMIAGTVGVELSVMESQTTHVFDTFINETIEQNTSQTYGRAFLGARLGPHGPGFVRPHVGANLAAVWYNRSTTIHIPNDSGDPASKTLDSHTKALFGWDFNGGVDLNFANTVPVEIGVRYVQSSQVPTQLGEGSVHVSPSYIQAYLGVGVSFDVFRKKPKPPPQGDPSSPGN